MNDAPALSGIQRVTDLEAAGDFERKHVPFIACAREDAGVRVHVKVGHWVAHPNNADHFIGWIELQVAGVAVARFDATGGVTDPDVEFLVHVDEGTLLTALASCNLHGAWASDAVAP